MKRSILSNVNFLVRKKKAIHTLGYLFVKISINGKATEISLKHKVDLNLWDPKKQLVKGSSSHAKTINNFISQVKSKINNDIFILSSQDKRVTTSSLKSYFLGVDEQSKTIVDLFKYHKQTAAAVLKPGTLSHYTTTHNYFIEFLETTRKTSDISLNEIDYKTIVDFDFFLRSKDKLNNNGVMKHFTRLKKLFHLAMNLEWITKNPTSKFKVKFIPAERDILNEKELKKLKNASFNNQTLQINTDIFVFACYTGLAHIEVYNLTAENICIGIDGQKWIYTKREKSSVPVKVPLLKEAAKILKKYKDHPKVEITGKLLPVYSNQKTNFYLKEIAKKLEINKHLTFHIARHTFATTITLSNGVPIETVSKLLGHTKIATTQIYAKVVDKKIAEDMGSLRKILEAKKEKTKKVNSK